MRLLKLVLKLRKGLRESERRYRAMLGANDDLVNDLYWARLRVEQLQDESDTAYHERARLLAWVCAEVPGVTALITDSTDLPGTRLLVVYVGGQQLTWHIRTRDLGLFQGVAKDTNPLDPLVKWDGTTTARKYDLIADRVRRAAQQKETAK